MSTDVAIIGAGAAGMMCAIEAGKRGRKVLLIDHARKLAEKIRISGGGRCNFTNRHAKAENYLSGNPDFCRSALARFTPQDFIALVERHGIGYHEKKLGQLFCNQSSQQIISMLRQECQSAQVDWQMPSQVKHVDRSPQRQFLLTTERNQIISDVLVIATGGLSIPQIGSTGFGYRIAQQFGLPVTPLRPALVGLSFDAGDCSAFKNTPGISLEVEVRCKTTAFRENMLLTHRGISGPAILQISSYWEPGETLGINLLPDQDAHRIFQAHRHGAMTLPNLLARYLPKRFVQIWCAFALKHIVPPEKTLAQYRDNELLSIANRLHNWQVIPGGTQGYKKAEVTLGGVDTHGLSSKTMESKQVPGLYFIGEVVDVTGQLGGYNFQWAWSSGYAAGRAV
ncbi:MAG: NAD(P)/FAD-dependent oxidoreductase [Nitrosomonas sp.]|nr:MAG: NAD(P)/FAD-dependent oxidoreductase [Nitrosomonas sp.]